MLSYSNSQVDLLYALINESNPGLLQRADLNNVTFGVPRTYTPGAGEIANTELDLYAKPGGFYIGKRIVRYRRIDPSKLFTNMVPVIDYWTNNVLTRDILIAQINAKCGLSLVSSDLASATWANGNTVQNPAIQAGSLCYVGTLPFKYLQGKRDLGHIFNVSTFQGRYWDSAYDPAKPLMTLTGFGIDYSQFLTSIGQIANGSTINGASAYFRQLINWFNGVTGLSFSIDTDHTVSGGLKGLTVSKFTLPNTVVPEADSGHYNNVLVIGALSGSWFCGKLLMHYNA